MKYACAARSAYLMLDAYLLIQLVIHVVHCKARTGVCLDCARALDREPYGQCLVCERGYHLACLAEKLDASQIFEEDPYVFCARCYTEAYDE
eukprot:949150-Prorocentrum_minimum.AAC.1